MRSAARRGGGQSFGRFALGLARPSAHARHGLLCIIFILGFRAVASLSVAAFHPITTIAPLISSLASSRR